MALIKRTPAVTQAICANASKEGLLEAAADTVSEVKNEYAGRSRTLSNVGSTLREVLATSLVERIRAGFADLEGWEIDERIGESLVPSAFRTKDDVIFLATLADDIKVCETSGVRVATGPNFNSKRRRDHIRGVPTAWGARGTLVLGWTYDVTRVDGHIDDVVITGVFVGRPIQVEEDGTICRWMKGSGWLTS